MQPPPPSARHLPRLDSLRGVGALMVMGFHSLGGGLTPVGRWVMNAAGFFADGRIGVVLFFVLSGLVLGHSLRRSGEPSPRTYFQFCVRRFFRIYPAFLVSTACYVIYYFIVIHHPGPHPGFLENYLSGTFTTTTLTETFFFCHQGLNAVIWTLKVEMIAAFLLPFMHYFALRVGRTGRLLLLAGLVVLAFLPSSHPTRFSLYLFYLGYLLSPLIQHPAAKKVAEKKVVLGALLLLAAAAFALGHLFSVDEAGRRFAMLGGAVGSTITLLLLIRAPDLKIFRVLDLFVLRYLGRISYSFYLFGLLSIDLVERYGPWSVAMGSAWTSIQIFFISVLFCSIPASLSYVAIERPFVKWGGTLVEFFGLRGQRSRPA